MTDKEIYQLIDEYKEDSDALYERIHEQVESSIVQHAQVKKKRKKIMSSVFSVATAFILIVCLAIVLPIVLQQEGDDTIRYNGTNIQSEVVNYTLKDYIQNLGEPILYLDWYDTADVVSTTRYYDVDNVETTVYMQEYLFNEGYSVELSVLKNNDKIVVETLEVEWDAPKYTSTKDGVSITYQLFRDKCNTKFEYEGYTYYLNFLDSAELEDFIIPTIESMFATI